jgi:hypothetical protein
MFSRSRARVANIVRHIGYLSCYLFYHLFDKEDKKESDKWDNELC